MKTIISELSRNVIIESLNNILNTVKDEIKHVASNNILEYIMRECDNCQQTKTILHRDRPVNLDKVYLPLSIQRMYGFRRVNSYEGHSQIEICDINNVFRESKLVTIIGDAGSGKSTLIKYLFLGAIRNNYKIPIKVELRYLNGTDYSIIDYILNNIIRYEGIADSERIINRMLISGKFVFFFDGYDELDGNIKSNIAREISQISRKYNKNSYILTSRPTDEINLLDGFYNYRVRQLSNKQIVEFVKRQYEVDEQEIANKIIDTIQSKEIDKYRHFLRNPLLLSMFIFSYQTDSHIPQKTSDFYAQVFNTLYSGHDTISKLGFRREKKSGLSKDVIRELLDKFSFATYWDTKYSFQYEEIQDYLNRVKLGMDVEFDDDALIYDLQVAINILTKDGIIYEFPHRSLQEYFAASFVARLSTALKSSVYKSLVDTPLPILASNYNFFYLLSELDIDFKTLFLIPYLGKIQLFITNIAIEDLYPYFRTIMQISKLFSVSMYRDFLKIHNEYLQQLEGIVGYRIGARQYMNKQREFRDSIFTPFLLSYNYNAVIEEIQNTIEKEDSLGRKFLNAIFLTQ